MPLRLSIEQSTVARAGCPPASKDSEASTSSGRFDRCRSRSIRAAGKSLAQPLGTCFTHCSAVVS